MPREDDRVKRAEEDSFMLILDCFDCIVFMSGVGGKLVSWADHVNSTHLSKQDVVEAVGREHTCYSYNRTLSCVS